MIEAEVEFTGSLPLRATTNFSAASSRWQFCEVITSSSSAAQRTKEHYMIVVEYRSSKLLGVMDATPEMRAILEPSISAHIEELVQGFDLSHLEKVVITDDFIEDVLEFQREQHYLNPSVTDNDKARALGKTLLNKETGLQVVFIDSFIGTLLLDNDFFDTVTMKLSQEQGVEELMVHRKLANNIITHEMAHVEFDSLVDKPFFPYDTYVSKVSSISWRLINEYYACKKAVTVESTPIIPNEPKCILELERVVMAQRRSYDFLEVPLESFITTFDEYTRMALIYAASAIGDAQGSNAPIPAFEGCRIAAVMGKMGNALSKCYLAIMSGALVKPPSELDEVIIAYHQSFEVFISDVDEGERWDIPVRL